MTPLLYRQIVPGEPIKPPAYKTTGASGMDLHAIDGHRLAPGETWLFPLGFAIELSPGYEAQIRPRSSLSAQGILCHFGTIDADYRGEIMATLTNVRDWENGDDYEVRPGDRIAQLVIAPVELVTLHLATTLSETERGGGGFGSSGR
jgi:dUTP pyrophosphatase